MRRPWTQDYLCIPCSLIFDELIEHEDRTKAVPCPDCDSSAEPVQSMPVVLRRTFPDGTRREGFREAAEASRLEAESFELPESERGEHQREIDALRSVGVSKQPRRRSR